MKRMIGLLMMVGLSLGVGCGGDSDSPTGPSDEITNGPNAQTLELWTDKYDNGNAKKEYQYFRDLEGEVIKHGYFKEYDDGGNLVIEKQYKEGERWSGEFGFAMEWNNDRGERVETEKEVDNDESVFRGIFTYSDGKWTAKSAGNYENGKVWWEGNYKDGNWVWYDEEGNITDSDIYEDGKCVEMCEGDK